MAIRWLLNSLFSTFTFDADGKEGGEKSDPADGGGQPEQEADKGGDKGDPAWLPKRLREEADAANRRLLKKHGLNTLEELEAKIKTANTFEESQRTAEENAKKQVDDLTKRLNDLQAAHDQHLEALNAEKAERIKDRVTGAITKALTDKSAKNPGDALILLTHKHADRIAKLTDDKGNVIQKDVDSLVEDFKKATPDSFGAASGGGSPSTRDGKAREAGTNEKKLASQSQLARITGKRGF